MTKFINYGRQCIEDDDIQAVAETLKSDYLTQGPKVKEFEDMIAGYCGAKYAIAFSSGTAALHGAYFAMGIGRGDEIITSPMTFLATANAALFLGGTVAFADIEPDTGNIDADVIEQAITDRTKAIVPVHYAGCPCDMEKIRSIAKKHDLFVVEDACHAIGAEYLERKTGGCEYSDMTVFSFHPVKTITTGEGGAVTTNDSEIYDKLMMFRQHGVTRDSDQLVNKTDSEGGWYYEMQHLGYNYRITDIQASLGCSQLKKLDRFVSRRREIFEIYRTAFAGNEYFDLPGEREYAKPAWHLYPIRLKDKLKNNKKEIFTKLRENGIGVQVHYIPVHTQPYYKGLGFEEGAFPNAEKFYVKEISLPMFPAMSDADAECVIETTLGIFK